MKKRTQHIGALLVVLLLPMLALNATDLSEEDGRKFDYFFMEANRQKMKGEYQKAAEMYQNCLRIDPESAVSHFELGKILLMAGDEDNALMLLRKATELNPRNEWYQIYLAGVFEHGNKYAQAIEVYEGLRKNNPSKVDYYYRLGSLYTQTEQYAKAIDVYDDLEALEGMDDAVVMEKRRLYLLADDKKGALNEIKRLVDKYPKEARYYIVLGDYYVGIDNYKKAKKAYNKASDIDENNGFLQMSLAAYYDEIGDSVQSQVALKQAFLSQEISYEQKMQILVQNMMQVAQGQGDKAEVEELVQVLKETHPEEANTYFFYANFLMEDSTQTATVVDNLKKVVELDASNEEAWMQLVQLAFQEEDFELALRYTGDAELGGVQSSRLYFYRGIAAHQLKNLEIAKMAYEKGIQLTTDNDALKAQLLGSLGDVYYELEEASKAFSTYEEALALDAHNTMVLNNYAYFLSEKDTLLRKAEAMSAKCIELDPGNPTFLDTYAWILFMRDNLLLAKFYMEQAIHNMQEDNEVLFDHYADILWANDEKEQAREYWQKAIDAGGDEAALKKKIAQE